MKRVLLLTGAVLALSASVALAGGVSLGWGTVCLSDAGSSYYHYPCNSNNGYWSMVSSFMLDTEMTDMVGFQLTMVATPGRGTLPDWWKLGVAPDCRAGLVTYTSDFSTVPQISCLDWSAGQASNTLQYTWDSNHAYVTASTSLPAGTKSDLVPGTEYYAGKVTIINGKTVGAGSCAGCDNCLFWEVSRITVVGLDGRRDELTTSLPVGNEVVWQDQACYTPARSSTWGQIKGLYR